MFFKIKNFSLKVIFVVFGCALLNINAQERISSDNSKQDVWLTIFVHGIIKTPWSFSDIARIMSNAITHTAYSYATEYLRNSNEYHLFQPMQEMGLKKINIDFPYSNKAASAISAVYNEQYCNSNNLYYTFGWLGLLSRYHREEEGRNLLKSLIYELERLKKENISPKIRIVAFSHGGNVALNMAKSVDWSELPFEVDELFLFGSPIQRETDSLILSPLFKKIYNFYSEADVAQTSDFLTSRYGVSKRKFRERSDFTLPEKLTQIRMRTTKVVFNCKGNIVRRKIKDPRHMELWAFGWNKRVYSPLFPIYPLPFAALAPTIVKSIDQLKMKYKISNNLGINIIPGLQIISVRDFDCWPSKYEVDFSNQTLNHLKDVSCKYKSNYSPCGHIGLMKKALNYGYKRKKETIKTGY